MTKSRVALALVPGLLAGLLVAGGPGGAPGGSGLPRGTAGAWAQEAPPAAAPRADSTPAVLDSAAADSTVADSAPAETTAIERATAALVTQAESAPPETVVVARDASVPVFLGGREVFRVRVGRDGLGPRERAAAIRTRLTSAVGKRAIPADSVHLVSTPEGIEVRLANQFLWLVTPADVEGVGAVELAAEIAELPGTVRDGILKERAGRRPLGVLISLLIAIAVSLGVWLLARLLWNLDRRWHAWLSDGLPRHVPAIRLRGFEVLSQAQLAGLLRGVLARLDVVVALVLLYGYITFVLSLFPWTQGWSWQLFNFAARGVVEVLRSVAAAVPGLLMIALILLLFRWLIALSDRLFDAVAAGTLTLGGFHPELAKPSKRILRIVLWIAAAMVAYPYIPGSGSRAVQGVSLLVGVMISIGSTGFVGNVISGIVLTYARSFRTGDRVRIGEHIGDVTSLGLFATKLRTIHNEELTLPNGQVASSAIINYTRLAAEQGLILHTEVTIGYDVDWRKVHALLIEAAGRVEGVEKEPPPWVFQRSLNDHHVSYELNCVTHLSHPQLRLYSDLHQEIQDAFARAGVEILSPAFHALRDGNAPALPQEPAGPRGRPSGFRVSGRES